MSATSQYAAEIFRLETEALEAAAQLAVALQAISNAYWAYPDADAPLFRCMPSTVQILEEIEALITLPTDEIKCAI